jgi:hypothetical protein
MEFTGCGIPFDTFKRVVIKTADRLQHRYTGFLTYSTTGNVVSFTHTVYPRKKYANNSNRLEVMDMHKGIDGMTTLAQAFDGSKNIARLALDNLQPGHYRSLFGLYIGQQDSYDGPPDHNIASIQARTNSSDMSSAVAPVEIFTVRFGSPTTTYSEPAARILGPVEDLSKVCMLGVALEQERFTIERAYASHTTVQMAETAHCKEPEFLTEQH